MREPEDVNPRHDDMLIVLQRLKPVTPSAGVARSIWYQSGYQAGKRWLNLWRGATVSVVLGMVALLEGNKQRWRIAAQGGITQLSSKLPIPAIQSPVEVSPAFASYARLLNSLLTEDGPRAWVEHELPADNPYA